MWYTICRIRGTIIQIKIVLKSRISTKSFALFKRGRLRIALQHVQSTWFSVVMPFQPWQTSLCRARPTLLVQCLSFSYLSDLGRGFAIPVFQVLC